jgi:hypothetical protein
LSATAIVALDGVPRLAPPVGRLSTKLKLSGPRTTVSLTSGMLTVFFVSPALKTTVPMRAR